MINHKSQGKGQIQVPKLTQPCSSLIGDIYQEKKHWKPDDSVRVVAIMLQIKARREHHAAAMLAHVESLATSCMQSSKANREIERRFAVARHEPKDVLWCDCTRIPTHPEKLASCSVLVHNSAHHLLSQITQRLAQTCAEKGGLAVYRALPPHPSACGTVVLRSVAR